MNLKPNRKNIRLKNYDYSQPGYYFVTMCARDKQKIFGTITGCSGGTLTRLNVELTRTGEILLAQWHELRTVYQNVVPEQMVIMPNHIHGIIIITGRAEQGRAPALGNIIGAYKSTTTKRANQEHNLPGRIIWQRNYYDHVIRNGKELAAIRKYIEDNPVKWHEDKYFVL